MNFRGWISAPESEREFLEGLGIKLGPYVEDQWSKDCGVFQQCEVSEEALRQLERCWGRFVFGLVRG